MSYTTRVQPSSTLQCLLGILMVKTVIPRSKREKHKALEQPSSHQNHRFQNDPRFTGKSEVEIFYCLEGLKTYSLLFVCAECEPTVLWICVPQTKTVNQRF